MKRRPSRIRAYLNSHVSYLRFNYGNKSVEVFLHRYKSSGEEVENPVAWLSKNDVNKSKGKLTNQVWLSRKEARELIKLAEKRDRIQRMMRHAAARISWEPV